MAKKAKKTAKGKAPPPRRHWLGRWLCRFLVLAVWGFVALLGVLAYYAYDLPDVDNLGERTRTPSVRLVSADGVRIARYGDAYATPVPVADLPDHVRFAVLATEDRRFYSHFGLDVIALARATLANLRAGRVVQGASTLTQQIAKNVFLTPERSFKRKIQELLLAFWLEHSFTKDQLLSIYLNRVYLGSGTYGIGAASKRYFGKPAEALTLGEAAMIAGLLKAPSRYAPTRDLERAQARARQVLGFMVDAGYIDAAEAAAASRQPFTIRRQLSASRGARYFADWVFDRVSDYTGPGAADITVVTTLDLRMQKAAEAAVEWALAGVGAERQATQAALVALAPDGAVRAMVGGRDYRISQFNRATQARRQPGSAFKPFVYLAALEAGMKPGDMIDDAPPTIDGWSPRNYDGKYAGPVSMEEALVRSLNTVAVRLAERVGRDKVVDVARRLGVSSPLRADASLALGASEATLLEITRAYTALANGGQGVWAHGIAEIRGAGGTVLYRRTGTGLGRVVEPEHLGPLVDMMSAVVSDGTGRAARVPWPSAGKTGTSQEWRDAWFVGFNRELTAGVWIGNDNGAPMKWVSGGGLPAQLWARFMGAALAGIAPRPLLTGPAK
jgi:penicillin-binding protein 1A